MAQGFNVGERYIVELPVEQSRRYMMEQKLKAAQKSGYPFFVISPPQFEALAPDLVWSIVDGVVGSVLAKRRFNELLRNSTAESVAESVGMSQYDFDSLSQPDRNELLQNSVTDTETECELEFNALAKLEAKLECELLPLRISCDYKTDLLRFDGFRCAVEANGRTNRTSQGRAIRRAQRPA